MLCGDYIKVRFTTLAFSKASELTAASQHAVCTALSPLVQARPWQCWCPGAAATAQCCAGTHTHHHQPATTPAQITQRTGQLPRPLNNLQKGGVRAWQQLPVCTGAVPEQPPPLQSPRGLCQPWSCPSHSLPQQVTPSGACAELQGERSPAESSGVALAIPTPLHCLFCK